jgi:hypothetical protein
MADQPYTLVVNDQGVTEHQIGTCGSEAEHCPGTLLNTSVKLLSNTVADGVRTVVISRQWQGVTAKHYTFSPMDAATIPYIAAVGSTQTFAYHKAHAVGQISLANPSGATCVCDAGATGGLCEPNRTSCHTFTKNCVSEKPSHAGGSGSLLEQANPTCNSRHYAGGLSCCSHKVRSATVLARGCGTDVPHLSARTSASCWTPTRR